jgi:hypothetical protein
MRTDLEPEGDEKCEQQGDQSAKNERMKHAWDINTPDQVKAKYEEEEGHDDGYIPLFSFLHLYVVDDLLVLQENDEHQGDKESTDEYDGGDPGLRIKRKIRQVRAGIEQHDEPCCGYQQRMKNMGNDFGYFL